MLKEHQSTTILDLEARDLLDQAYFNGRLNPVASTIITVAKSADPIHHPLRQEIGIAIEGGGLGSSVTKASDAALEVIGDRVLGVPLRNCVKAVGGSSGGAPNALYFVAGRGVYGMHAYPRYFVGEKFIRNPLKPRNLIEYLNGTTGIIDLNYLRDRILASTIRFDDRHPLATKLLIMTTKVDPTYPATPEARAHVLKDFANIERAVDAAIQGMYIPILAGRAPSSYQDRRYLDGGIAQHLPRQMVVSYLREQGAQQTYTLCLSSVPMNSSTEILPLVERIALKIYPHLIGDPKLVSLWSTRYVRAHGERRRLHQGDYSHGVNLAQIIAPPADGIFIKMVERNAEIIKKAQAQMMVQTFKAFGITDPRVQKRLYASIPPTQFEVPR